MTDYKSQVISSNNELLHYGHKGMKWGQHIFGKEEGVSVLKNRILNASVSAGLNASVAAGTAKNAVKSKAKQLYDSTSYAKDLNKAKTNFEAASKVNDATSRRYAQLSAVAKKANESLATATRHQQTFKTAIAEANGSAAQNRKLKLGSGFNQIIDRNGTSQKAVSMADRLTGIRRAAETTARAANQAKSNYWDNYAGKAQSNYLNTGSAYSALKNQGMAGYYKNKAGTKIKSGASKARQGLKTTLASGAASSAAMAGAIKNAWTAYGNIMIHE